MKIREDKTNRIYWGNLSTTSYFFGTTVKKLQHHSVLFENVMIPSSQVIKEWSSNYNFQGSRRSPELPLLKRNQLYTLVSQVTVIPEKTIFFEIIFKNRYGEKIGNAISKDGNLDFMYPNDAYSYTVRLMSAGLEELRFDFLEIIKKESMLEN